jgi:hypothetical protein
MCALATKGGLTVKIDLQRTSRWTSAGRDRRHLKRTPARNAFRRQIDVRGGLVDACFTVTGEKITDANVCRAMYPTKLNPRLAAGEPLAQDVLKCQLKKVDARDYARPLTAGQLWRLKASSWRAGGR